MTMYACVFTVCEVQVNYTILSELSVQTESKNSLECVCVCVGHRKGGGMLGVRSFFKITSSLSLPSLF